MRRSGRAGKKTVSLACTVCRTRKLKCDGNKPCERCIKLDTPKQCIYNIDKRKDKRTIQNGSRGFLFKNRTINNDSGKNEKCSEDLLHHLNKVKTPELDLYVNIPKFGANDALTVNDEWNNSPSMDFDFNDFNTEGTDLDDFLNLLGDNSHSIGQKDLLYSPGGTCPNGVAETTESEEYAPQRSRLIDVLFEDESHVVPGISKWHLLDLELRYGNLESTEGNSDEKFLLSTALFLGSLTIRKRELLNHSTLENYPTVLENGISKLSADAFRYYNIAKALIPDLLSRPTVDGFCGLVLMANFMTMMTSLEGQLYLSINALQLAVALNLNDSDNCKKLIEANGDGIGLILLFWNVWCSSCMLTTLHGRNPFLPLEDITTPLPFEIYSGSKKNELSINFMQVRIQIAALQGKILQEVYTSNTVNKLQFINLEKELEKVSIQVTRLKGSPIFEERLFCRSRVLMLELSCLRAQASLLLYRPYLINRTSLQALTVAKSIIHEIWSHYTKQFPSNKKERLEHLDWNFCLPLRTASLTLCVSCIILLRYKQAAKFFKDDEIFECVLAMEILQDLVQVLPIEQKLINLVKTPNSLVWSRADGFVQFWGCMLDQKSS
ncbi:hypothetical protein SKDZ_14G3850 [Saccharomyces kudriavzevii ZP591]|nr:hypothetical protein SKDZ_14G3850 [Saccharomyces kudriavzevii ZP591]